MGAVSRTVTVPRASACGGDRAELPAVGRRGGQPNPFVAYEDKEVHRAQERKWLLQDTGDYMNNRLRSLRRQATFHRQLSATQSAPFLPRIEPTSLSHSTVRGTGMRLPKAPHRGLRSPAPPAPSPAASFKKDSPMCVKSLKGLQKELKDSLQLVERSARDQKAEPRADLSELHALTGLMAGRW